MLSYTTTTAQTETELEGILLLQQANLPQNLSAEEIASQGFVTVVHSPAELRKLNDTERHIIAKDGDKVIAYLLAMTAAAKADIPILKPMFDLFGNLYLHGKPVSSCRYIVVGQVCVSKDYRGQGVLDACYFTYKNTFQPTYDFAITEIATRNTRSINAHKRIGFREIHCYKASNGEEWSIVVWEW